MATLGLTRLAAINRVLRGAGFDTVTSAPSPSDTDEAADAEDVLDAIANLVLTMGFPENTEMGKAYTPNGISGAASSTSISVAFTDAAFTQSSHTITKASAFDSYVFNAADSIYLYSDTGDALIQEGYYGVASRASANAITLDHDPAIADNTRIAGRIIGDLKVSLGSDVLKVRSSYGSPNGHRSLVLNADDVLYDADNKTDRFETDDTIYLDVTRDYTFENLSPQLKETIVAHARLEFQRWKKKLIDRDSFLLQELTVAEQMAARNPFEQRDQVQPFNTGSAFLNSIRSNQLQREQS